MVKHIFPWWYTWLHDETHIFWWNTYLHGQSKCLPQYFYTDISTISVTFCNSSDIVRAKILFWLILPDIAWVKILFWLILPDIVWVKILFWLILPDIVWVKHSPWLQKVNAHWGGERGQNKKNMLYKFNLRIDVFNDSSLSFLFRIILQIQKRNATVVSSSWRRIKRT